MTHLDITDMHPTEANALIKANIAAGERDITLTGVNGQRFIGAGVRTPEVSISIEGTAGNDLAMFAEGVSIRVDGNAQDGVANTMSFGSVVVDGHAGDVLGYGMRGGEVYVRGDIGYRAGIHMKEFGDSRPQIVIGGRTRDFLGEYMAGGVIVVLGFDSERTGPLVGDYTGAGMHAGVIYVRGSVDEYSVGAGLLVEKAGADDMAEIERLVSRYASEFGADARTILSESFIRISPASSRPYGNLYAPL